jgi:hypothetical protein
MRDTASTEKGIVPLGGHAFPFAGVAPAAQIPTLGGKVRLLRAEEGREVMLFPMLPALCAGARLGQKGVDRLLLLSGQPSHVVYSW